MISSLSLPIAQAGNAFQQTIVGWFDSLTGLGEAITESSPSVDAAFIIVLLSIAVLFLVVLAFRSAKNPAASSEPDRLSGALGKMEKIERTVNELRSESLRSIEIFKRDVAQIKLELREIRRLVGGGSDGGNDGDPFDSGDFGGGSDDSGSMEALSPELEFSGQSLVSESLPEETLDRGLSKTRQGFFSRLKGLFVRKPVLDESSIEELETELIASDVGIKMAMTLVERVRAEIKDGKEIDEGRLQSLFREKVVEVLEQRAVPKLLEAPTARDDGPTVVLVVGVNGVGKTTTIAKLAKLWSDAGRRVVLGAGDTFRAAAVEQLSTWGERLGVPVVTGAPDAKPSTVAYEALAEAKRTEADILILDTAGRLHTKSSLMQELEGIRNALKKQQESAPHHVILVVDGATGQNALAQAREFNAATGLTGLIVTKLDGTPKGGIVVAICDEIGIPVEFIGVGENAAALQRFEPEAFAEALFGPKNETASRSLDILEGVSVFN